MVDFSKIPGSMKFGGKVERSLRRTFSKAVSFFVEHDEEGAEEKARRRMLLSLVRSVLESSGPLTDSDLESLRELLADDFSPLRIERMVSEIQNVPPVTPEEAAPLFVSLPEEERERLIRSLLILGGSSDCLESCRARVEKFAGLLGFSDNEFLRMLGEVEESQMRRLRIMRSGAGVLVALIVIGVFILTATLLRSVIFGLIAAYVLLPLEKYFERRLRRRKGLGFWLFQVADCITGPLRRLAVAIQRRSRTEASPEEQAKRGERRIINQAVTLTCGVLLIVILAGFSGLSALTNHYVRNLKGWTQEHVMAPAEASLAAANAVSAAPEVAPLSGAPAPTPAVTLAENSAARLLEQGQIYLEHLRQRFEDLPLVKFGLDQISRVLNDESAQQELVTFLLRRTGGLFSFTAGVIGTIGVIVGDLLLTIFFFLLFLSKLAEFCGSGDGAKRQSEYLVRTVFNGNWLPGASQETVAEAQRIIGEVIAKLRIWVRGYVTLMAVDATVYTTAFFFLRVPYFPLLGMLAGCGILLPYIGPVLSAMVTVLVTLAVGGDAVSGVQLAGIVGIYLLYNGVIEQFILYPAVIGESLGLTTLETIIVVLLGAIFAGIPGMILAIPAASVIKYLVPQIYRCWGRHSAAGSEGGK